MTDKSYYYYLFCCCGAPCLFSCLFTRLYSCEGAPPPGPDKYYYSLRRALVLFTLTARLFATIMRRHFYTIVTFLRFKITTLYAYFGQRCNHRYLWCGPAKAPSTGAAK